MITGPFSTNLEDDNYNRHKTGNYKNVRMIFYRNEFEYLIYGFNYCFDYVKAVSELQDCNDNFFFEAKTLSTSLMHLLQQNKESTEDISIELDKPSLETLSAASDLILYMAITLLKNFNYKRQYNEDSIRKCYETFAALKKRIEQITKTI